jgi:hypothetical protein
VAMNLLCQASPGGFYIHDHGMIGIHQIVIE